MEPDEISRSLTEEIEWKRFADPTNRYFEELDTVTTIYDSAVEFTLTAKKIQTPNTKTTVQQCVLIVFRINQSHIKHRLNVSFMPLTVTSGHWPLEILPCGVSESNAATLH